MSGGHFNACNYVYYEVDQFADELEHEIELNRNTWKFSGKTITKLRLAQRRIRKIAKVMKEIDYLYSGDHGETSFLKALERS